MYILLPPTLTAVKNSTVLLYNFLQSWYTESNAQIVNGNLRIQAREERGEGLARVQQACWDRCGYICAQEWGVGDDHIDQCVKDCGSNRCPTARFTSSRIRTFGKFSIAPSNTFKVVRIEAKIKLACKGNGMWPAFWMLPEEGATSGCSGCGKYGQWPASGEIDIMEMFGGSRNPNQINGTLHYGGVGAWSHLTKSAELKQTSDGFHTFAIEWEKDEIRWLADGEEYGRIRRATVTSPGWWTTGSGGSGPFDVNFHILLNLAVGGEYTGNVPVDEISRALSNSGQYMDVDYVRVHGKRR
jgi:beta-glucanase (GH16 family)